MTENDAKEWVTIKIPEEIRDNAREDSRTYGEIMKDGLEHDAPLRVSEEHRAKEIVEAVREELDVGNTEVNGDGVEELAEDHKDMTVLMEQLRNRLDRIEEAIQA